MPVRARRIPLIIKRLPDGSYLSTFGMGKLPVRMVEAWITVTYADGTVRHEQWRLATSLTDPARYPARELVALYHERWQVETTYFSIKATMLDSRVLRSHRPQEVDQEVYALLTACRPGTQATQTLTWNPEGKLATSTEPAAGSKPATATGYLYDADGELLIRRATTTDGDTVLYLGATEVRLTVKGGTKTLSGTLWVPIITSELVRRHVHRCGECRRVGPSAGYRGG